MVVASAMAKCRANAGDFAGERERGRGRDGRDGQPHLDLSLSLSLCSASAAHCSSVFSSPFVFLTVHGGATEELRRLPSAGLVPNQRSFAPVLAACARPSETVPVSCLSGLRQGFVFWVEISGPVTPKQLRGCGL